MTDDPDLETPWTHPPPVVGDLLPRAADAIGVRYKLETYSLDVNHKQGGPKARGFERILGITIEDIDYLEAMILDGAQTTPIRSISDNPPHGVNCVLDMPIHGLRDKRDRVLTARTVWEIADTNTPPRLVSAYPNP
jgi:hypothetical protein